MAIETSTIWVDVFRVGLNGDFLGASHVNFYGG